MRKTIFNTEISFLPKVNCPDSEIKSITLAKALLSDKWRKAVENVRQESNPEKQKAAKENLPCFTPSGMFSHVCANGLQKHSGFICIDIDAKDNTDVKNFAELKEQVHKLPHVAYCGLSVRGKGYFLIIPIKDATKHREYFKALAHDFEICGLTIDKGGKDICRKRFVSFDDNPYINTGAKAYDYTLPEIEHTTQETFGRALSNTETIAKLNALVEAIEQNRWDITGDYAQWIRILSALATTYGESGRDYAHKISSQYGGYQYEETEAKYNSLLKHPEYKTGIGTLFYIARAEIGKHDFDGITL